MWSAALPSPDTRGDATLRDRLYHVHMVQHAFLRVWKGITERTGFPTFDDAGPLMDYAREFYADAKPLVASFDSEALARPMPVPSYSSRECSRWNTTKICSANFSSKPMPLS